MKLSGKKLAFVSGNFQKLNILNSNLQGCKINIVRGVTRGGHQGHVLGVVSLGGAQSKLFLDTCH